MKQVEKKLPMEEEKETKIVSLGRQKCRRKKKNNGTALLKNQDSAKTLQEFTEASVNSLH